MVYTWQGDSRLSRGITSPLRAAALHKEVCLVSSFVHIIGGLYLYSTLSYSQWNMTAMSFVKNYAEQSGGGMYSQIKTSFSLTDSVFRGNLGGKSVLGAAYYSIGTLNVSITNSDFTNNRCLSLISFLTATVPPLGLFTSQNRTTSSSQMQPSKVHSLFHTNDRSREHSQ